MRMQCQKTVFTASMPTLLCASLIVKWHLCHCHDSQTLC